MISDEDRIKYAQIMKDRYNSKPGIKDCLIGALKGKAVIIDYRRIGEDSYIKEIRISDQNDSDLRAQGYKTGVRMLSGWRYILTPTNRTYVRIHGFRPFDATKMGNFETSSTLMDWFHSDSEKQFTAHLVKIKMDPMDIKRLGIICAGVLVGVLGYFLIFGGL